LNRPAEFASGREFMPQTFELEWDVSEFLLLTFTFRTIAF
jgi:hypothetical protein